MTKRKKVLTIILTSVASLLIVTAILLMSLFIPLKGKENDTEYWSAYDTFNGTGIRALNMDGEEFKILQLTDLHYHLPHKTTETDNIVKKLVAENNPDMIVITGDSVFGVLNGLYSRHLTKLMDSLQVPWAIVYGNHDEEGKANKFYMGEQYENSEYGLYQNGAYNIGGTGNYVVNLEKDGAPFYSFVMMDSNRVTQMDGKEEYGSFTPSQVEWYGWTVDGLKTMGYQASMMFFHIPFPEYLTAYELWEESGFDPSFGSGEKNEGVCAAPYNPGMFAKIKEGAHTSHVFVGHDHVNNFSIKHEGVVLTYGTKSSRQFSFSEEILGGTLITINQDKSVKIERKFVK